MPDRPKQPRRRGSVLALIAFVIAAALLLVTGIPLWVRLLFVGLATGAMLGQARRATVTQGFEVDADGVRELAEGVVKARILWAELIAVSILTSADGAWSPDFFWVLHDSHGQQVIIPLDRAATTSLLTRLGRLPRFDHQAVIRATSSTSSAEFTCWEGEAGEGSAAGGEIQA